MIHLSTNSFSQSVISNSLILKYRIDTTWVTGKNSFNNFVWHTAEDATIKAMVDFIITNCDTNTSSPSETFQTVLNSGNKSNKGFFIGKNTGFHQNLGLVVLVNASDSSCILQMADTNGNVYISVSKTGFTSTNPIKLPYLISNGTAPTFSLNGSACGSGASYTISGSDGSLILRLNTGTGIVPGETLIGTIITSVTHANAPVSVIAQGASDNALSSPLRIYNDNLSNSTTGFAIDKTAATDLSPSSTYYFHIIAQW